jgi:hypothetical protein
VFKDSHLYEGCTVCWNQYISDQKLPSTDRLKQQNHTQSRELCFTVSVAYSMLALTVLTLSTLVLCVEAKIKGNTTKYGTYIIATCCHCCDEN